MLFFKNLIRGCVAWSITLIFPFMVEGSSTLQEDIPFDNLVRTHVLDYGAVHKLGFKESTCPPESIRHTVTVLEGKGMPESNFLAIHTYINKNPFYKMCHLYSGKEDFFGWPAPVVVDYEYTSFDISPSQEEILKTIPCLESGMACVFGGILINKWLTKVTLKERLDNLFFQYTKFKESTPSPLEKIFMKDVQKELINLTSE